jgi:hypothetical protein
MKWTVNLPVIAVIAGAVAVMVVSLVWGIVHYVEHGFQRIVDSPLQLQPGASGRSDSFTLAAGESLQVSLLMNSRAIELQDIELQVDVQTADGRSVQRLKEGFGFTVRSRVGQHVYYHLGTLEPQSTGSYRLAWTVSGSWRADQAANLLVRRPLPGRFSWAAALGMLVGAAGLMAGLRMLTGR